MRVMAQLGAEALEPRLLFIGGAVLNTPISPVSIPSLPAAPISIPLGTHFSDIGVPNPLVDMNTTLGHLYFQLDNGREPIPTANFLAYVNGGRYDNTVFDRSVASRPDANFGGILDDSFIQGGGFTTGGVSVTTGADQPINDTWRIEDSNGGGFLGMARVGNDPNSAKSEFFVNVLDNSTLFDARFLTNPAGDSLGGFAVFGQTAFRSISNSTLSAIAAISTADSDNTAAPLYPQVPGSVNPAGLASIISATQILPLIFSVTSSNPGVTGSIAGTALNPTVSLSLAPDFTGSATITVTATAIDHSSSAVGTFTVAIDSTPPTASLAAAIPPVVTQDTALQFGVDFTDDNLVDLATLDDNDVVVTGPDNVPHTVTLTNLGSSGSDIPASFTFAAPSGHFGTQDNGVYTITVPSGAFADAAGNTNDSLTLGQFTINVDSAGPTALASGVADASRSASTADFIVQFSDATAVSVSSLSGSVLSVTTLHSGVINATFQMALSADGTNVAAVYRIDLGHLLTPADNGVYAVTLPGNTVSDTLGNSSFFAAMIGSFTIALPEIDPPTAQVDLFAPVLNHQASIPLVIDYFDNTAVDASSIASGNFTVIDPHGISHAVTLVSAGPNGTRLVATYAFAAPSGTFTPADNGVYSLVLTADGVADTLGNKVAAGTLGAFNLDIDGTAPTAFLSGIDPVGQHSPFASFIIWYSDDRAISSATLGADDVRVTNSSGFAQNAALVSFRQFSVDGILATYHIAAPSGGFNPGDTFTIKTNAGAVADDSTNPLPSTTIATFTVDRVPVAQILGLPDAVSRGDSVTLTAGANDPALIHGLSYSWQLARDGVGSLGGTGAAFTFVPDVSGNYTVTLLAHYTEAGQPASVSSTASFPVAPVGTFTAPTSAVQGSGNVVIRITDFAESTSGITVDFDINGSGEFTVHNSASAIVPADRFDSVSSPVIVRARVTDSEGISTIYTRSIEVVNAAPAADFTAPEEPLAGAAFTLHGLPTDPSASDRVAGFQLLWSVIAPDGSVAVTYSNADSRADNSFVFTPPSSGRYQITLQAVDQNHSTGAATTHFIDAVAPGIGVIDSTFNNGSGQTEQTILLAGLNLYDSVTLADKSGYDAGLDSAGNLVLFRFNSDGTPDTSYGASGSNYRTFAHPAGFTPSQLSFASRANHPVVLASGTDSSSKPAILRFTIDGSIDRTFNHGAPLNLSHASGAPAVSSIFSARQLHDNNIVVAAEDTSGHQIIALYTPAGRLVSTFHIFSVRSTLFSVFSAVAEDPATGDLLVAKSQPGIQTATLLRLSRTGKLLLSKSISFGGLLTLVNQIVPQSDGKVLLVAGTYRVIPPPPLPFASSIIQTNTAIASVTSTGSPDPLFATHGLLNVNSPADTSSQTFPISLIGPGPVLRRVRGGSVIDFANANDYFNGVTPFITTKFLSSAPSLKPASLKITASSPVKPGAKIPATLSLLNIGDTPVTTRLPVTFYFSTDGTISTDDRATTLLIPLAHFAPSIKAQSFNVTIPVPALPGPYYLFARINPSPALDLNPADNEINAAGVVAVAVKAG